MRPTVAILFLCVACGDGDADSTTTPTGTTAGTTTTTSTAPPTHDADIQPIWEQACAGCHIGDNDGFLNLDDAYDKIVGVPSVQVPSMNLVEPGSLEDSYLWRKIEGTHLEVGGDGSEMPRGFLELRAKKRSRVEQWILDGAPR